MLAPLAQAHVLATELARLFEQAGCRDLAHEADVLARHAEQIDAQRDAANDERLAQSEAESLAWEARSARELDAWVKTASVGEIQKLTGTF